MLGELSKKEFVKELIKRGFKGLLKKIPNIILDSLIKKANLIP